jgi:hypothetical protein
VGARMTSRRIAGRGFTLLGEAGVQANDQIHAKMEIRLVPSETWNSYSQLRWVVI